MKRLLLIMLAAALLTPALVSAAQLAQRRTLRESFAAAGCHGIATERQFIGSQTVFAVSAAECVDGYGMSLSASAALEKIADLVWSAPAAPFDVISATVYRSQGSSDAGSRIFSSDELQARWGVRAPDLDWAPPDLIRGGWLGYLALPAILMVLAMPVVLGVIAARRGVFVLFWRP